MKRLTVAFFLIIVAFFLYFLLWNILGSFRALVGLLIGLLVCSATLLAALCTVDSLMVVKPDKVLVFQRKGLFINETKTFKLCQIAELQLRKATTYSKLRQVTSYKLQLVLISTKTVDLFKSFSKKEVRESVSDSHSVCPTVRVFGP